MSDPPASHRLYQFHEGVLSNPVFFYQQLLSNCIYIYVIIQKILLMPSTKLMSKIINSNTNCFLVRHSEITG
jgi:hypothetical protein